MEIQVRPSAGGSTALVQQLKRGGLDIAFVSLRETPAGVATTELGVEDLQLVGRPELLPARRARIGLSALADAAFVDFPAGWGIRVAVDHAFAAAGLNRRITIEVADVETS